MMAATAHPHPADHPQPDEELVARIRAGERAIFAVLIRRHNRRLFRAARAILGDDAEAEDVVQDAYVRAYTNLDQFAGRAAFATWLTRIAVHEALARARRRGRFDDLEEALPVLPSPTRDPEQRASDAELARMLESAIDALPPVYRGVFMLREVEGLSTAETAASLDIPVETAKTRLHRARALLRGALEAYARPALPAAFPFAGARCDRIVAAVMARIDAG
jgi:RNA polymerase sigma-70 factor (ECF subfamily)